MNNNEALVVYCLYFDPKDYPGCYVVREWINGDPNPLPLIVTKTLEEARAAVFEKRPDAVKVVRSAEDDKVILESWL